MQTVPWAQFWSHEISSWEPQFRPQSFGLLVGLLCVPSFVTRIVSRTGGPVSKSLYRSKNRTTTQCTHKYIQIYLTLQKQRPSNDTGETGNAEVEVRGRRQPETAHGEAREKKARHSPKIQATQHRSGWHPTKPCFPEGLAQTHEPGLLRSKVSWTLTECNTEHTCKTQVHIHACIHVPLDMYAGGCARARTHTHTVS